MFEQVPSEEQLFGRGGIFPTVQPVCRNPRGREQINHTTGEIKYMLYSPEGDRIPCEKNSCPDCVIVNAQSIASAIHLSSPSHSIFLSQVGNTADGIQRRMSLLATQVRKQLPDFQWVWAVEDNPSGTGVHLHGFFYFSRRNVSRAKLEQLFRKIAISVGIGRQLGVQSIDQGVSREFFGYPMKMLSHPVTAPRYVELNRTNRGITLVHASKHFWRDGPTGTPIQRIQAEQLARHRFLAASRAGESPRAN